MVRYKSLRDDRMKFKVGDLVRWTDFIGIITAEEFVPPQVMWRVQWTDGGVSIMYADEIERVHSHLEAINESR
jgi:hypothetical protein